MSKVKVDKEVFEALGEAKKWFAGDEYGSELLERYINKTLGAGVVDLTVLYKYRAYELAEIIFKGYELELSPEEKVKNKLESFIDPSNADEHNFIKGMLFVIHAYDLKITEGDNK